MLEVLELLVDAAYSQTKQAVLKQANLRLAVARQLWRFAQELQEISTPRRLRNDNGHRFARKLRRFARGYAEGRLGWADINPAVQSWIGHARHADTEGLRRHLFGRTIFQRGSGRETTSA
jgi:hypothetical protein